MSHSPVRPAATAASLALGAILLVGCSAERLVETALERVDGVEDVAIDTESGNVSIQTEDGGLDIEVDEEQGTSTVTTPDGTATSTVGGELPQEVADVIDLPSSFVPQGTTDLTTEDGNRAILVQGSVTGDFDSLMDELEAAVRATGLPEIQRSELSPGVMGAVFGHDESGDTGVQLNLVIEGDADAEGMLQVMVIGY
jgi:copper chaperone CopZ